MTERVEHFALLIAVANGARSGCCFVWCAHVHAKEDKRERKREKKYENVERTKRKEKKMDRTCVCFRRIHTYLVR